MDLGVFTRSRLRFGAWIATPIVLIAGLAVSLRGYAGYVDQAFGQRRDVMRLLPQMESRLRAAQAVASRFAVAVHSGSDPADVVQTRLSRMAQQSGFVVNSLVVQRGDARQSPAGKARPGAAAKAPYLTVTVSGEATLAGVIRFLSEVQHPDALVVVESASVKTIGLVTEPLYSGDFVFRHYVLTM
jgi:hypothetical protein